jgi:hypothetical protein
VVRLTRLPPSTPRKLLSICGAHRIVCRILPSSWRQGRGVTYKKTVISITIAARASDLTSVEALWEQASKNNGTTGDGIRDTGHGGNHAVKSSIGKSSELDSARVRRETRSSKGLLGKPETAGSGCARGSSDDVACSTQARSCLTGDFPAWGRIPVPPPYPSEP